MYEKGVSCPHCFNSHSEEQKQRFREREKQVTLAKQRGESHLGSEVTTQIQQRKNAKLAFKAQQQAHEKEKSEGLQEA